MYILLLSMLFALMFYHYFILTMFHSAFAGGVLKAILTYLLM